MWPRKVRVELVRSDNTCMYVCVCVRCVRSHVSAADLSPCVLFAFSLYGCGSLCTRAFAVHCINNGRLKR